jgi:hypothetical protein
MSQKNLFLQMDMVAVDWVSIVTTFIGNVYDGSEAAGLTDLLIAASVSRATLGRLATGRSASLSPTDRRRGILILAVDSIQQQTRSASESLAHARLSTRAVALCCTAEDNTSRVSGLTFVDGSNFVSCLHPIFRGPSRSF